MSVKKRPSRALALSRAARQNMFLPGYFVPLTA
jgi:hypothetical protein